MRCVIIYPMKTPRLNDKKARNPKTSPRVAFLVLLLLLLIPTTAALANSMPPPFQIFLRFIPQNASSDSIDGVQLVGCEDSSCATSQNLIQYGASAAPGFLTTPPVLQESWHLECAGLRCLFQSDFHAIKTLPPYLRVIALQGDEGRASEIFPAPDCDYCTIGWKVDMTLADPVVTIDDEFVNPDRAFREFFLTYIFTILVEVLTAAILVAVFRKLINVSLKKVVLTTLLANLLSYPISWLVIPSFGQFQTDMYRKVSVMVILVVVIGTVVSILLRKKQGKIKKGMIITLAIAIPVCAVLFLAGMLVFSYGNYRIHVNGLPWNTVVILAEVFAVFFESFVLAILLKPEFSYKKALLISLVTNAVSFLLGLLLFL